MPRCFLVFFVSIVCCSSCARVDAPVVGRYRATLDVAGHELPFFLDVARENDRYVLIFPNAGQRLQITDVRVDGRNIEARLPSNSTLQVRASRSRLRGTLTMIDSQGAPHSLELDAELGEANLFFADPSSDNADLEGRWDMSWQTTSGAATHASATLDQDHDAIVGLLTFDSGQQHALHGQVHDEELRLASLTWSDARVFELKLNGSGALEGHVWQLSGAQQVVSAKRSSDAPLDTTQVRLVAARKANAL